MIDIINYLIVELGQAGVSIWTWVVADYEVEVMTALIDSRKLREGILIVDYSAGKRNPRHYRELALEVRPSVSEGM